MTPLDVAHEEFQRLQGRLYPPTPMGIHTVKHEDTMQTQIGTYTFLPPEAFAQNENVNYSGKMADLWAAGVTLYMFLIGKAPFLGPTKEATANLVRTQKLNFVSPEGGEISSDAKDLLEKMLAKKEGNRLKLSDIKSHSWVKMGGEEFDLSSSQSVSINITQKEIESAVTHVDLSIGINPMTRSKSWSYTAEEAKRIKQKMEWQKLERARNEGADGTTDSSSNAPRDYSDSFLANLSKVKAPSIGKTVENSDIPGAGLTLQTNIADSGKAEFRPLSVPARQIRPGKLKMMLAQQELKELELDASIDQLKITANNN